MSTLRTLFNKKRLFWKTKLYKWLWISVMLLHSLSNYVTIVDSVSGKFELLSEQNKINYRMCSIKKLFLKILQNSQENTCVRIFFKIFKNTFFIEHFRVTTSDKTICKSLCHEKISFVIWYTYFKLWWYWYGLIRQNWPSRH